LIEIKLFNVHFEHKLRPNKINSEVVVFCWQRFHLKRATYAFLVLTLTKRKDMAGTNLQ